jgi:RNA polymerase sigma-70 factor (ECF subfamily)
MIRSNPRPKLSGRKSKIFVEATKGEPLPPTTEEISPEETLLKYWPQISFRVRNSIGRSTPDWEDVGSEILVGVIEAIRKGTFRGESALGTFIYSVTTHKIVDHIRQKKRALEHVPEPGQGLDPCLQAEKQERIKLVAELLKSLKPRHADILYLHYYLDLSRNEIARIYDISPARVGSLIAAARNTLRDLMKSLGVLGSE